MAASWLARGKTPEHVRQSALVESVGSNVQHRSVERLGRLGNLCSVDVEERQRGTERRSLVPVDERLILGDTRALSLGQLREQLSPGGLPRLPLEMPMMRARPPTRPMTALFVMWLLCAGERTAAAGCGATCEGKADVTVTPPLDCAKVTADAQDCGCAAFLQVDNLCGFPLAASGVTLLCDGSPCSSVDPDNAGVALLRAHGTGPHEWSLRIQGADGEHVARVTFDVSSFDDGASCAVSSRRSSSSDLRWEAGVALALAACGRLRRSRRPHGAAGAGRST